MAARRQHQTCACKAYNFTHRAGGGRCVANQPGPFCGACGMPAKPVTADFGIGSTEFWGSVATHRDVRTVSNCCEAELFNDACLTEPYHPKNDE